MDMETIRTKGGASAMKKGHSIHGLELLKNCVLVAMTTFIITVQIVLVIHGASRLKNLMGNERHAPDVITKKY